MDYSRTLQLSIFFNIVAITLVLVSLYHEGINMDIITAVAAVNLVLAVYLGFVLYKSEKGCKFMSYETAIVTTTILINALFLDYAVHGFPTYFGKMQKDTLQVVTVAGALVCSVLYIFVSCHRTTPKKKYEPPQKKSTIDRRSRRSVMFIQPSQRNSSKSSSSSVLAQVFPARLQSLYPESVKTTVRSDISAQCDEYEDYLHNSSAFCRICAMKKLVSNKR